MISYNEVLEKLDNDIIESLSCENKSSDEIYGRKPYEDGKIIGKTVKTKKLNDNIIRSLSGGDRIYAKDHSKFCIDVLKKS